MIWQPCSGEFMDFGKIWEKYGIYIALGFMMLMMFSYSCLLYTSDAADE